METNENSNHDFLPAVANRSSNDLIKPEPREAINVRVVEFGNEPDFAFIDGLHRKNTKNIGWWPRGRIEGHIEKRGVLIAENAATGEPLGFIISTDLYKSHEDVGCIFAVCVADEKRRGLIGATLVQHVFERAAWGCRLFCCWCAQDLPANRFWESLGFVPLAFRTGADSDPENPRIHIFWQKRVRAGDVETPYWYPSKTDRGSLNEERLAIPIPPGTHWSDPKPAISPAIPGTEGMPLFAPVEETPETESSESETAAPDVAPKPTRRMKAVIAEAKKKAEERISRRRKRDVVNRCGLRTPEELAAEQAEIAAEVAKAEERVRAEMKKKAAKRMKNKEKQQREKRKYNPELLAASRELCARFMEEVNTPGGEARLLAQPAGKYDVTRALDDEPTQLQMIGDVIDNDPNRQLPPAPGSNPASGSDRAEAA